MKIIGLDVGDSWTGIAVSDALGISAKPFKTVATSTLEEALRALLQQTAIAAIVIGLPKTMRGTHSAQTDKVAAYAQQLQQLFPDTPIHPWDERLSSQRAQELKPAKNKEEKLQSHAIAAAFILQSYLDYRTMQNN
ncbi:MAG: Holliday junction resolvase RuvX [Candidatus Babeliales bacterium]